MLRTIGAAIAAGLAISAAAAAQEHPTEFGVDVGLSAAKASGGGDWLVTLHTPVDLRVGFHAANGLAIEPRVAFSYVTIAGYNTYALDPGVNLLFGTPGSTPKRGTYVTVGADYTVIGGSGLTSESYISFNGGFGVRSPTGNVAQRPEMYVRITPKQGDVIGSSIFELGMRMGLSFFN